jgi:amino acid transporter
MIVLCFAEVGSRFTETGGPYLYAREAFGPTAGFTIGWLMWIARITAFAANTNILLNYMSLFWPEVASGPVRTACICALTLVLASINLAGVRDVAVATNLFAAGKLIPLALLIVVGSFHLDARSFALGAPPSAGAFSSAMLLLVYAYTGFEMAVIPAGEIRDPRRILPSAILTGIAITAVFYILIQVVCIGTLPGLTASDRPLADAAGRFLGLTGAAIISVGAAISIAGNLNVVVLAASRLPYAMARRGELPPFLGLVHQRFHTPHAAILLTCALMLTLTLAGSFLYATTISVLARLLIYGTTCAALPVLRKRAGTPPAAFRAPAGGPVSLMVVALAAWLLCSSTWHEVRDTGIVIAVGLAAYALSRRPASNGTASSGM